MFFGGRRSPGRNFGPPGLDAALLALGWIAYAGPGIVEYYVATGMYVQDMRGGRSRRSGSAA